ncbi:uncharacterized protein LOC144877227 [Branchiostoma floridae x Branchiostoma japonicum]
MVKFGVICMFIVCLCISSLLPVAESDVTVSCSKDFSGFNDDTVNVSCPARCISAGKSVWGTGVYTDDSGICRAAIHDGRITDDGGQVTVYRWPGQDSYQSSYNNGIQTRSYSGSWPVSFAFTRDTVWCSTDSGVFDDDPFTVTCPAGCSPYQWSRRVWGTGVYRSDSSICRAAIHDGRLTDDGGQVTVYRWPGQDSYQSSTQNGVQTEDYTNWNSRYSSFAFTQVCPLGMEDGTIEDEDITASSHQDSWPPSDARLNGNGAWVPSEPFAGSWIQVDLGQRKTVSGVITQGFDGPGSNNYWITEYEVHYLNTSENWEAIKTQAGNVMTFSGNTGTDRQKTNMFDSPIVTQKIRLHPTDWPWWRDPGLRMELLGCNFITSTSQPTTVIETTSPSKSTTGIRTTSTTQPTDTSKTIYTTYYFTKGNFSSVTLSTALFSTGLDHEGQIGARRSLSVGTIAGIAAGVAVVLIAMVVFVIIFLRKRQTNNTGASNVPKNASEQRFRNPEYSGAAITNEDTASAQDEGYTDCELYNNTEENNPYEPYNYANSGQIPGGETPQPHDYDYATIPGESARGVVDNVIYESSDMT